MAEQLLDLLKFAAAMDPNGAHHSLVKSIKRAYSAASALADLKRAEVKLTLLDKLQTKGEMPDSFTPEEASALVESLFVSSVLLYARATEKKPIVRWFWWSANSLSSSLRETHNLVIHLRDKEFAHFGHGKPVHGEPFIRETLALDVGTLSLVFRTARHANRPSFVRDVIDLVKAVALEAEKRTNEQLDQTFADLKIGFGDPEVRSKLIANPVTESRILNLSLSMPEARGNGLWTSTTASEGPR